MTTKRMPWAIGAVALTTAVNVFAAQPSFMLMVQGQGGSVDLTDQIETYVLSDMDLVAPTDGEVRTLLSESVLSTSDPFQNSAGEWYQMQSVEQTFQTTQVHTRGDISVSEVRPDSLDQNIGAFTGFTLTNPGGIKYDDLYAFMFGNFSGDPQGLRPSITLNGQVVPDGTLPFNIDPSGWTLFYSIAPAWDAGIGNPESLTVQLPAGMTLDYFTVGVGTYSNVRQEVFTDRVTVTDFRQIPVQAPSPIPEPNEWALMLVGMTALCVRARQARSARR